MTNPRVLFSAIALSWACAPPAPIEAQKSVECRAAIDCGAPTPCETRTCDGGVCRRVPAPAGTLAATQTDHDCKRVTCDESGRAIVSDDGADGPPDDGNSCTIARCDDGQPKVVIAPVATRCERDGICARDAACVHFGALAAASGRTCTVIPDSGEIACFDLQDEVTGGPMTRHIEGVRGAVGLATARFHSCASFTNGEIACWGDGFRLGLGGPDGRATIAPKDRVVVPGVTDVVEMVAADHRTCARSKNGDVSCWGAGSEKGAMPVAAAPTVVKVANLHAVALDASYDEICAADASGAVLCWGVLSEKKHLSAREQKPKVIAGIHDAIDVGVGEDTSCALRKNGSVACWGKIFHVPDLPRETGPVAMKGLEHTAALAMTWAGGCAIATSGDVACFTGIGRVGARPDLHGARRMVDSPNEIIFETADGTFVSTMPGDSGVEPVPW